MEFFTSIVGVEVDQSTGSIVAICKRSVAAYILDSVSPRAEMEEEEAMEDTRKAAWEQEDQQAIFVDRTATGCSQKLEEEEDGGRVSYTNKINDNDDEDDDHPQGRRAGREELKQRRVSQKRLEVQVAVSTGVFALVLILFVLGLRHAIHAPPRKGLSRGPHESATSTMASSSHEQVDSGGIARETECVDVKQESVVLRLDKRRRREAEGRPLTAHIKKAVDQLRLSLTRLTEGDSDQSNSKEDSLALAALFEVDDKEDDTSEAQRIEQGISLLQRYVYPMTSDLIKLGRFVNDLGAKLSLQTKVGNARRNRREPIALLEEALEIRKKAYGTDVHPEIAITMVNLAVLLLEDDQQRRARSLGTKAYEILRDALGPNHEKTRAVYEDWVATD